MHSRITRRQFPHHSSKSPSRINRVKSGHQNAFHNKLLRLQSADWRQIVRSFAIISNIADATRRVVMPSRRVGRGQSAAWRPTALLLTQRAPRTLPTGHVLITGNCVLFQGRRRGRRREQTCWWCATRAQFTSSERAGGRGSVRRGDPLAATAPLSQR